MTDSPLEHIPAQAPIEGADPGEDREVSSGADTDTPDPPHAPADGQDPGGPDTQLAAEKD